MLTELERTRARIFAALTLLALVFSVGEGGARAQDEPVVPEPPAETEPAPEQPLPQPSPPGTPSPGDDTDTWVQIDSGEWMRGEIDRMRDDVLYFDSEEFDDQETDWDDVVQLISPRPHRYVRNYEDVVVGTAIIMKEEVRIKTADGEVVFPRSELTGILPGADREGNRWSAYLGLAVDANFGASEQVSLNGHAWIQREDYDSRIRLSYDGSWGQSDGTVNVQNAVVRLRADYYFSDRFYATPVDVAANSDPFLNLAIRVVPGAGGGMHVVDEPVFEWDVGGSVGYVYTLYDSVAAGEAEHQHDLGIRLNTAYEWDITGDIDFDGSFETLLVPTDIGLTQFVTKLSLSLEFIDDFNLDLSFRHTRLKETEENEDGTIPDQDQFQFTVGLGWEIG